MRRTATKDSTNRENTLVRMFNGEQLSDAEYAYFSCPKEALNSLKNKASPLGIAKVQGGLGKHYDFTLGSTRGELKHSVSKGTTSDVLEWQPWLDGVQFLQGQTKSKNAQPFIGGCGLPMWTAWFTEEVLPFAVAEVPAAAGMTFDAYYKCASGMSVTQKQTSTPAGKFILALRQNAELAERLRLRWIAFEERWLPVNPLDHAAFETRMRQVIEEKDVWIAINKTGAFWIEGFSVLAVTFEGCEKKRDGGCIFRYSITLQKKSGGQTNKVPIAFKLHWKNGGQAVQNLNFMVI
uniref:Uncharacterized protein n=1 Tax=viral metagenome TaxID=1070528 RepID=A0A6C0KXB3_9ZZZZ